MDTDQLTNEPTAEPSDAPETVPREDLDRVMARLDETTALNQRLLSALEGREAPRAPQPPAPEPEPDIVITDDDEGDARTTKLIQRAMKPLREQINQFTNLGVQTISRVSERTAMAGLSESDRLIATRYKKDLDAYLSNIAPQVRMNPESLEWCLKLVKADHFDELTNERVEAAGRQVVKTAKPGAPAPRGTATVAAATEGGTPTPEDLFGKDSAQVRAIEERGGPDAWAKRSSQGRFKNWSEYAKAHAKWSVGGSA